MKLNRLLLRLPLPTITAFLFGVTVVGAASAQSPAQISATAGKTFIDYFQPTPILSPLSTTAWGAATVGPRDQKNGLEDSTMKLWDYWDGQIIHSRDGKYHIFASRWEQSFGHNAWFRSKAVHAVSDNSSLSEIARLITGTRWSGPLFFGLKKIEKRRYKA